MTQDFPADDDFLAHFPTPASKSRVSFSLVVSGKLSKCDKWNLRKEGANSTLYRLTTTHLPIL